MNDNILILLVASKIDYNHKSVLLKHHEINFISESLILINISSSFMDITFWNFRISKYIVFSYRI